MTHSIFGRTRPLYHPQSRPIIQLVLHSQVEEKFQRLFSITNDLTYSVSLVAPNLAEVDTALSEGLPRSILG